MGAGERETEREREGGERGKREGLNREERERERARERERERGGCLSFFSTVNVKCFTLCTAALRVSVALQVSLKR